MMDLMAHTQTGCTTLCHAWAITRTDGQVFGFTDHDQSFELNGIVFEPDTGFSAMAVFQELGMSVDNTEALGALRDDRISVQDLKLGRFDGAQVVAYLVNWKNPDAHSIEFRGTFGEIITQDGQFRAEIRGLSQNLNKPLGLTYQAPCSAVLGDTRCGVDIAAAGYSHTTTINSVTDGHKLVLGDSPMFDAGWFTRGRIEITSGPAKGIQCAIKNDQLGDQGRIITLWDKLLIDPNIGDTVLLVAGCDKQFATCRAKFNNAVNFRGFPDIPSHDWVMVHPNKSSDQNGGSRR